MSETLDIPLNSVNDWLEKETVNIVEPLRADAKKLLADIKSKLEDLTEACNKLLEDAEKEMAKGSNKTYRRAKFLYKLAGNFADLIDEIVIPEQVSGTTLNEVSDQIKKILKTIIQERTKWFRAISPYFIISRRRFDATLKRTDDSFRNFTDFISEEYIKAEQAEGISSKVEELNNYLTELDKYDKGKEARIKKKEHLQNRILKNKEKIQSIQSKGEVVELGQFNSKIEDLTKTVKHEIRHIQKPLLKFQTLVNNPGYNLFPEANTKLEEYLENPFNALATEKEGYPLLKQILQKIDRALDNKKMKLKTSRLRKAKDQIDSLVNRSTLVKIQKECREFFDKKHALLASGTINEFRDEKTELHDRLKDLKRKMGVLEVRDARLEKQHKELHKRVEQKKKSLEKIVSELSNKIIKIQL